MFSLFLAASLALLGLFPNVATLTVPTSFGCKDSLISDEWRKMVLEFHNNNRRNVALNKQPTKSGVMPGAKNMNELTWDCNIEHQAWEQSCEDNPQLPNDYSRIRTDITMNNKCNITSATTEKLRAWWNEARAVDLTVDVDYQAGIENFGLMVNAIATGFTCTYNKCTSGGKLVCMYDKTRDTNNNKALYEKGNACANCGQLSCVNNLCQPVYTVSAVTNPKPQCTNSGMTNDLETTALNLHNYYRRLLATGWAKDSKGYAKWASKMPALAYECTIADHAKGEADCTKASYSPNGGNTLSFYKGSYTETRQEVLEKAIKSWWDQLEGVDLPDDAEYTADVEAKAKNFAYMAQEAATKMGCAVTLCKNLGYTVAICEYNNVLATGDTLYSVGRTCSKCDTTTMKCDPVGGLCVTK